MEHRQWLRGELKKWKDEELVSGETAAAIWERYRHGPGLRFSFARPLGAAAFFCLLAGLAFSGAGVWSLFSQGERFMLALAPFVLSLVTAAAFLFGDGIMRERARRRRAKGLDVPPGGAGLSPFLRESAGLFHGIALNAAVWMTYDTFRLSDDLYLLLGGAACCLLVMLYVLRSAGLGIILSADAAAMAWLAPAEGWPDAAAWALLAASFPFFLFLVGSRRETGGIAFAWGWIAAVLTLTFFTAAGRMWQIVFFSVAASLTWLGGELLRDYGWLGTAFRFFGGTAVFGALLAAAFGSAWQGASGGWLLWTIFGVFLLADAALLLRTARRREWLGTAAGLTPFVMGTAAVLSLWDTSGVSPAVLVSCFLVFLSIAVIARGVQKGRDWQLLAGTAALLADGAVRLWDSSLTFGQRGTFFLFAGLFAGVVCLLLSRPRRHLAEPPLEDMEEEGDGDDA